MVLLPAYTLLLGLIALLGYMALASGVKSMPQFAPYFAQYGTNFAVPALFLYAFPSWFVGVAFAAIAIGALVPAAIMSIAAANLYTRNVHKEFLNKSVSAAQETLIAKRVSLVVKLGALFFVLFLPLQYAIQLQLLGGIWIIQTLPAIVLGLYTRWLDHRGLLIGWFAGIAVGTWMAASTGFKSSVFALHIGSLTMPGYAALYSLFINLLVAVLVTALVKVLGMQPRSDATQPEDYSDAVHS